MNQGAYIDFSYVAHERHRELRELLTASPPPSKVGGEGVTTVSQRAKDLLRFLDSSLKSVALQNFRLLIDHHFT